MFKDKKFSLGEKIKLLADLGFFGIHKEHGNAEIPHKKTKLKALSDEQKQENRRQASKRVAIVHLNRDCKYLEYVEQNTVESIKIISKIGY